MSMFVCGNGEHLLVGAVNTQDDHAVIVAKIRGKSDYYSRDGTYQLNSYFVYSRILKLEKSACDVCVCIHTFSKYFIKQ